MLKLERAKQQLNLESDITQIFHQLRFFDIALAKLMSPQDISNLKKKCQKKEIQDEKPKRNKVIQMQRFTDHEARRNMQRSPEISCINLTEDHLFSKAVKMP